MSSDSTIETDAQRAVAVLKRMAAADQKNLRLNAEDGQTIIMALVFFIDCPPFGLDERLLSAAPDQWADIIDDHMKTTWALYVHGLNREETVN